MNNKYLLVFFVSIFLLSGLLQAQDFSKMDKSPLDVAYYPADAAFRAFEKDEKKRAQREPVMRIMYSRPSVNGRMVFGDSEEHLIKFGKVWRLGANENTELTVIKSVSIGGQTVEPGRYSLHVKPEKDHWSLMVNTEVDGWGSYAYDESKTVATVMAGVYPLSESVEALSIVFRDHSLQIAWDKTMVSVPVNPAAGMGNLDKSPLDIAYFPARAAFRAFEKDEAKRAKQEPVMRVVYSRPQAKGRALFGSGDDHLVQMGKVWRLGANESAELQVIKTANIGGKVVEPGRYGLYVIPNEGSWTLVLNTDLDGWGAYAYDESKDVMRVEGTASDLEEAVEALSVQFSEDALMIAWGKTKVTFPVKG